MTSQRAVPPPARRLVFILFQRRGRYNKASFFSRKQFCWRSLQTIRREFLQVSISSQSCVLNANLHLLMEAPLSTSRRLVYVTVRTCSISRYKSDPEHPLRRILRGATFCHAFLSLFSPGAFAVNSEFFSFTPPLVFTLCCFHYANTKLVAGLMFFFFPPLTFSDGKWD